MNTKENLDLMNDIEYHLNMGKIALSDWGQKKLIQEINQALIKARLLKKRKQKQINDKLDIIDGKVELIVGYNGKGENYQTLSKKHEKTN